MAPLLLMAFAIGSQAQFSVTTNNNAITITGYSGSDSTLTIPDTINGYPVTAIGNWAFNCAPLSSLTFSATVTNIGAGAFSGCINLTNVQFDTNLRVIGNGAFGMTKLASVAIPANVSFIGNNAFYDCANLTNISVDAANPFYRSEGGVLFSQDQSMLVEFPSGVAGSYSIPAGVTTIGDCAFYDCNLTNIVIPAGVTTIGMSSFYGCQNLTRMVMPSTLTLIRDDAFGMCANLRAVYFQGPPPTAGYCFSGDNLTVYYAPELSGWPASLGGYPTAAGSIWPFLYTVINGTVTITNFTGNGNLDLPATIDGCPVTTIGIGAFANSFVSSITLPDSVIDIETNAFLGCSHLTNVDLGANVQRIGDHAFGGCVSLTAFSLPNTLTQIGESAFSSCLSLTEITIPAAVTNIGDFAFGFSGLTNVTILSQANVADWAFTACQNLLSVHLEQSSAIGTGAFSDCANLAELTLSDSVANIGDWAFARCYQLTNVVISQYVTNLGQCPFAGCSSLTNIAVDPFNPNYSSRSGSLFDKMQSTLIECPGGFAGAYVIPTGVTAILDFALQNCASITSIYLPASVTNIGFEAFGACPGMTNITVDPQNPNYCSVNGILFNKTQTTLAQFPGQFRGDYQIPASVTDVSGAAFYACQGLTSLHIPATVTNIESEAFSACPDLTNIVVDANNPVYSSDAGALFNKSRTDLIQYPAGVAGNYRIPNLVTNLDEYAFEGCSHLTRLTIPDTVENLVGAPFISCSGLSEIYFQGNAPGGSPDGLLILNMATLYYLPGTTGWDGVWYWPRALWNPQPQVNDEAFGIRGNQFGFNITGTAHIPIVIEASSDLGATWVAQQSLSLTNGSIYFQDSTATNFPKRFYRIRSP